MDHSSIHYGTLCGTRVRVKALGKTHPHRIPILLRMSHHIHRFQVVWKKRDRKVVSVKNTSKQNLHFGEFETVKKCILEILKIWKNVFWSKWKILRNTSSRKNVFWGNWGIENVKNTSDKKCILKNLKNTSSIKNVLWRNWKYLKKIHVCNNKGYFGRLKI